MTISITIIIIIITSIISFFALNNRELTDKLIFYPPAIAKDKQWYRFFTNGFIHADIGHLLFNMYSFYLFGPLVENAFTYIFKSTGELMYALMYVSALALCLIPTYSKNKENYYYRSLGASGAVSAVIFVAIFLQPVSGIGLIFIPNLTIPGFIFGALYLIISAYLDKKGKGNINHSAHFWGALYGIMFLIVMSFALHTGFNPFSNFVDSIHNYLVN